MGIVTPTSRPFVLLTGATGLVGGVVLARLLKSELPVAVLVRDSRSQTAQNRMDVLMARLEERFGHSFTRPVVINADLCLPSLGLSPIDLQWIANNCGSVIHSAANLLFRPASQHPNNEPFRTNVEGTTQLLAVTDSAGIFEWHYVSTAYVAGLRAGKIREDESDVGQQFGNDYERSKTIAEQMLRRSPRIRSLTVYRPSIVIDLHPTTSMRSDQTINSAFAMFKALSQRFGLPERGDWFRRLGFNGHERKNIVTVDWVATMISEIYRRPELHGQTFHLTSPTGTAASDLEDGFRAAVLESGIRLPAARAEATALIDEQAAPFFAAFSPYFKDDPIFDRTHTARAMAVCGESELQDLSVDQLRDFCMRQTKPGAPASQAAAETPLWSEFLQRTFLAPPPALGEILAFNPIGLTLSGHGGGQWLIVDGSTGPVAFTAASQMARSRVFMTTITLNRLFNAELSLATALECGALLLEVEEEPDSPEDFSNAVAALVNRLTRVIAEIQRQHFRPTGLRSEVANVG